MTLWASMLFNGGSSQRLVLVLQLVPYLLKVYVSLMSGCIFSSIFIAENLVIFLRTQGPLNEIQVGIPPMVYSYIYLAALYC